MVTGQAPDTTHSGSLPQGVSIRALVPYVDDRGTIVELDRESWHTDRPTPQWTALVTDAGVMRGGHLHLVHQDRLALIEGHLVIGLADVRRSSTTAGTTAMLTLHRYQVLTIPAGVVHCFYSPERVVALNGTSQEYDPTDDLEVRYDDPAFGFDWRVRDPLLSHRDTSAPGIDEFLTRCRVGGLDVVTGME